MVPEKSEKSLPLHRPFKITQAMKQRHIITLAIIAGLISCTGSIPNTDRDEDARSSEPQDTTNVNIDIDADGWDEAINVDFTITGTPTE